MKTQLEEKIMTRPVEMIQSVASVRSFLHPGGDLQLSLPALPDHLLHLLHEAQAQLILPRQSHALHRHWQPLPSTHSLHTANKRQGSQRQSSVATCRPTAASQLRGGSEVQNHRHEGRNTNFSTCQKKQ